VWPAPHRTRPAPMFAASLRPEPFVDLEVLESLLAFQLAQ
jgi:hypothetical protein